MKDSDAAKRAHKSANIVWSAHKISAETRAESQAICGIIEMNFRWMPDAVANHHRRDRGAPPLRRIVSVKR